MLSLSVLDVSATEVFLHCTAELSYPDAREAIYRNGRLLLDFNQASLDTVIRDSLLIPNQAYSYKLYKKLNAVNVDSSSNAMVSTLDSTSHLVTWQVDTLGSLSYLNDAVILNDSLVIAVGEIYFRDSVGIYSVPYGIAEWNGHVWSFRQLFSRTLTGVSPIRPRGVFAFNPSDIWFADGGVFHWNGTSDTVDSYYINYFTGNPDAILSPGQSPEHLWGVSSSNLYTCGVQGALAHYDGVSWHAIQSGTTSNINDIWGRTGSSNSQSSILCAVSNIFQAGEKKLLKIDPSQRVSSLTWSPQKTIATVWFSSLQRILLGGSGVFVGMPDVWENQSDIPNYFTDNIRGTGSNDIFAVGAFGQVAHFNGLNWVVYPEVALPDGQYLRVAVSKKLLVAVGDSGNRAVVARGSR